MSGICSTHSRDEEYIQNFSWKTCMERPTERLKRRENIEMDVK